MNDRERILAFLSSRCDTAELSRLAQEIGLKWSASPFGPLYAQVNALLAFAERDGLSPALRDCLERTYPKAFAAAEPTAVPAGVGADTEMPTDDSVFPMRPLLTLRDGVADLEEARRQQMQTPPSEGEMPVADADKAPAEDAFAAALAEFERQHANFVEGRDAAIPTKPFCFVHGYTLPRHWARRDQEIAELTQEIRANRYRVLSLIAIGGTGKSALSRKLLDELPRSNVRVDGAVWFSFYIEPDFDRFLTEACRYLIPTFEPAAHPSPYEKGVMLREALENGHYLVVLDGIEVLLVSDRARDDFGSFQDRALREFLEGICEKSRSQVLVSSRFPLQDLENNPAHHTLQLADLSLESADELLSSYGVAGATAERRTLYERFGSHALTLQLLGYYLSRFFAGEPNGISRIPELPAEAAQGIKLQSVLNGIWELLQPDERYFLTRMSAFRGGVDERSLIVLNKSGDAFNAEFRQLTERLIASPMVTVERREGHARLTSHPLIKNFFYERMADSERGQTHRALKDYAQGLPLPDRPRTLEDYEPLLEACHHCLQVGLYTEAYQMYRRNNMDNALRWWGHYAQAHTLLEPLREASQGEVPAWKTERWQISWVENETALLSVLRGDTETARARFRRSVQLDAESGDASGESASWQNLAGVLVQQGDFDGALAALEKSRNLEAYMGRYEKEDMLAGLEGVCQAELGRLQRALGLLVRAVGISTHKGNLRALCYWTWRIGDVYLQGGQPGPSRKQHEDALDLAKREQFRDYEGHALRGLGDGARAVRDFAMAHIRYASALRIARTLGNPYLENEVRLGLARLGEAEAKPADAQGQARQVLARADECGYSVQATAARLVLARCSRFAGDGEAFQTHLQEASRLQQQTCHYAMQQELNLLRNPPTTVLPNDAPAA